MPRDHASFFSCSSCSSASYSHWSVHFARLLTRVGSLPGYCRQPRQPLITIPRSSTVVATSQVVPFGCHNHLVNRADDRSDSHRPISIQAGRAEHASNPVPASIHAKSSIFRRARNEPSGSIAAAPEPSGMSESINDWRDWSLHSYPPSRSATHIVW